ncbi:MOSC domain-containing protein, partial [Burkholderia pseudomallei]|nr:MOSC domain-containing protein [Burkholderia pseudomallei]MBF3605371.1 MOSC domain-containing protein [Burkholderia pseudomallei]
ALEALSRIDALPPSWRQLFERRLKAGAVEDWTKRLDG